MRDLVLQVFPALDKDDVRSAPMGVNGADLMLSKLAQDTFRYAVECKNKAKPAIYTDWEQAVRHSHKASIQVEPVLIIKGNYKQPLAVIDAKHFMRLVRDSYDLRMASLNLDKPDE